MTVSGSHGGVAALIVLCLTSVFIGAGAVWADARQAAVPLMIQTVPKMPGVTFSLDGNTFSTDRRGLALTTVTGGGRHQLSVVTQQRRSAGVKMVFAGWSDGFDSISRQIEVNTFTVLQAGFGTGFRTEWSFVDHQGAAVGGEEPESVTVVDDRGDQLVFSGAGPHFVPGIRVVATDGRFAQEKISYRIVEAVVNGIDVTAQVPESIDLGESQRWAIDPSAPRSQGQPGSSGSPPTEEQRPAPAVLLIASVVAVGLAALALASIPFLRRRAALGGRRPSPSSRRTEIDGSPLLIVRSTPMPRSSPNSTRGTVPKHLARPRHLVPRGKPRHSGWASRKPVDSPGGNADERAQDGVGEQSGGRRRRIGKYVLLYRIAEGARGDVYRGQDAFRRQVVIKLLEEDRAEDCPLGLNRPRAEAAAKVKHDNIVPLQDFGASPGPAYVVSPFVEGESLRDILEREGRLGPVEAAEIACDIAAGLQAAHDEGVVHGALNPSCILVSAWSRALIVNLGVPNRPAVHAPTAPPPPGAGDATGASPPTQSSGIDEMAYQAPEQCEDSPDIPADIYSLGVMLCEMVTGTTLQSLNVSGDLSRDPGPMKPAGPFQGIPVDLRALLLKATAQDPKDRFASAGELVRQLEEFTARHLHNITGAEELQRKSTA